MARDNRTVEIDADDLERARRVLGRLSDWRAALLAREFAAGSPAVRELIDDAERAYRALPMRRPTTPSPPRAASDTLGAVRVVTPESTAFYQRWQAATFGPDATYPAGSLTDAEAAELGAAVLASWGWAL